MSDIHDALFSQFDGSETSKPNDAISLEKTTKHAMAAMRLSLQWQHQGINHRSEVIAPKLNLWRDIFPFEIEQQLIDKAIGFKTQHTFAAGTLLEPYQKADCLEINSSAFNRQYRKQTYIEPQAGRFYPKAFITGVRGIFPEDVTPFRVIDVNEEKLTVDLNHPLCDKELTLGIEILDIWQAGAEHGGSCHDIVEMLTLNGPGLQARWQNQMPDYWSDMPFSRMVGDADSTFYALKKEDSYIDTVASQQIGQLYKKLLPANSKVLDLMAGKESHLPAQIALKSVHALGMNQTEMQENSRYQYSLVHDLNLAPNLPYENESFDAVICSLSVEYMCKPFEIFTDVARILKPGGIFIVTFSNNWISQKVIRLWEGCHEYERPAIVLEYFLRDALFDHLNTWSIQGLFNQQGTDTANPVYAVWGTKGNL